MNQKPIRLLLVEDDPVDIMEFQRSAVKYKLLNPIYIARDATTALDLLKGKYENGTPLIPDPRIVLLDLNLPDMYGLDLLRLIRSHYQLQSTVIIAITGSRDERDRTAALDLNVAQYFTKPVDFDQLVRTIAAFQQSWDTTHEPGYAMESMGEHS